MKVSFKGAAAAAIVGASLFVSTAFAQTGPIPLPSLTTGSGAIVSVWDTTKNVSLVAYLGVSFADLLPADMTPAEGKVLDFNIAGFSSAFASSDTANLVYTVWAGKSAGAAATQSFLTTGPLGGVLGTGTIPNNGNVTTVNSAGNTFVGQVNTACGATVPCLSDATASPPLNTAAFAGTSFWGANLGNGLTQASAAGAVGSALGFFQVTKTSNTAGNAATVTRYENATGLGQWLLSSNGNLQYSIAGVVGEVPLPAAVWLLLSGLAGLGTIGRRRKAAVAA